MQWSDEARVSGKHPVVACLLFSALHNVLLAQLPTKACDWLQRAIMRLGMKHLICIFGTRQVSSVKESKLTALLVGGLILNALLEVELADGHCILNNRAIFSF